jgi:hypothetical protein
MLAAVLFAAWLCRYREDVYGLSISSYPATADAAWQQQALDDKPPQVVGVLDAEA